MLIPIFLYVAAIEVFPVFSDIKNIHRSKRSDDYVPCERGWYYFREKCYKAVGHTLSERLPWDKALDRCRSWGADLVSIQSQEEQDFAIAFLQLDVQYYIWIGLNDRVTESHYMWTDGSSYNYTNWAEGEPSGIKDKNEDCVVMVIPYLLHTKLNIVGKWNDRACDAKLGYVCKMNAIPRKRSPNPMYCSTEAGGGFKYLTSCYHVVKEIKSWEKAERHCKAKYNGHLVTIRDKIEDRFLDYILANMRDGVWIGIKIKDQLQQKWTSGWYVSYNGFDKDVHFTDGSCVARKARKEWITVPCANEFPFICEVYEESPPVLKKPARGSQCPTESYDWRDFGGEYCYHIENKKAVIFNEAIVDCKRRGGDSVSLHSREEAEIFRPFFEYEYWTIYIGLIRSFPKEEKFAWTDGSALDFEDWRHSEPNDQEEKCVEVVVHDIVNNVKMKWNDVICEERKPYICSVKKIVPNSSSVKDTDGCASFCIVPTSYLYGVITQCAEAKQLP